MFLNDGLETARPKGTSGPVSARRHLGPPSFKRPRAGDARCVVSLAIIPTCDESFRPIFFVKILVAPDKFKGSLSAVAAADAITKGFREVWPEAEMISAPIADGGEGFADALRDALGGEWIVSRALDPIGREVEARFAWVEKEKLAIIDMSEASGLWRLKAEERAPLRASTYGTGQLMRRAMERGARKILVGLGGSATTDGGIGMAAALGYEFLTSDGEDLEAIPGNLLALIRIVRENALEMPEIVAACDVQNPLLGPRGAARVFGPQKGANEMDVVALEEGLLNLADLVAGDLECDFRETPGAGAAGGIAFGLMSFCGAKICSGFDLLAETLRLEERIAACDLVITGEGRIDGQTLEGKGPAGVALLARKQGKPVLAFAGSIAESAAVGSLFDALCAIIDEPVSLDTAMARGAEYLTRSARRAARLLKLGQIL
jgi:glycerate kinase